MPGTGVSDGGPFFPQNYASYPMSYTLYLIKMLLLFDTQLIIMWIIRCDDSLYRKNE